MPNVPTYDLLFTPTLLALRNLGGSATNDEIFSEVARVLEVDDEVLAIKHGDRGECELQSDTLSKTVKRLGHYHSRVGKREIEVKG